MKIIPSYVLQVANSLNKNGFEAYLVGGSLRDILMNRIPKDYDIATNALPDQVLNIFPKSIATGAKYGTVIVLVDDDEGFVKQVEVTTYRDEKEYVGGRWPSSVSFSTKIFDDLKRRDFTINAMALDLAKFQRFGEILDEDLIDLFGGKEDLKNKIIKCVRDPIERFREDGLRSLRACRLASILGFTIEDDTLKAIKETIEVPALISKERVRDEIRRLIEDSPKPSIGIELMRKTGLLQLFIPELLEGYKLEHNSFHVHDIYQHILDTVDIAPKDIRIAALFHDIGKPRCKDGEHFYGHDMVGAEMTKEILTRLRFPTKFIEDTVNLIRWHMFFIPKNQYLSSEEINKENIAKAKEERKESFQTGWSEAAIRRFIRNVGGYDNVDNLIKLRIADAVANPKSSFDPSQIQELAESVARIKEKDSLLSYKDLQINGNDLMALGFHGMEIQKVKDYLLECVTDDIELNEKEDLIRLAKEYKENPK